ncbi:MAG: RnfABCDGE type electron transport complex subunit D [Pseudomonadales bacterium]|jgi:electron transport complex protein RnfD
MNTRRIMALVLLALLPGAGISVYFYGTGYLTNMVAAVSFGLALEALCLGLQRRAVLAAITDCSTLVTCVLLVLALPPQVPFPVLGVAIAAAVILAKHLYGGLGNNLFNPAVVGYAVVLVSFPSALADWPIPLDGVTNATALVSLKYREGATVAEAWTASGGFGTFGGYGWEWINFGYLIGGLGLLLGRLAAWRIPLTILATIGVLAALGYDNGSQTSWGSPSYHWLSGATMLTAFFFATDPVSHPASAKGQFAYAILIGAVIFVVRSLGNYPDGAAFAVLLGNAVSPYLDRRLAVVEVRADA